MHSLFADFDQKIKSMLRTSPFVANFFWLGFQQLWPVPSLLQSTFCQLLHVKLELLAFLFNKFTHGIKGFWSSSFFPIKQQLKTKTNTKYTNLSSFRAASSSCFRSSCSCFICCCCCCWFSYPPRPPADNMGGRPLLLIQLGWKSGKSTLVPLLLSALLYNPLRLS